MKPDGLPTMLTWAAWAWAAAAAAQTPPSPPPSPEPPPAVAPSPDPSPSATPPRTPWVAGYKNGFTLQSETGDFALKLTGYVQADGRFAPGDDAGAVTDTFLVRRVRPIFQGTVARYFDFYVAPDFGGGTTVLQDAYLDVHFTPKLRFRAGKIRTPFGLERIQSAMNIFFIERALPNNLVPNRDVGLQVHGDLAQGAFSYQVAVLDGVPDGGSVDLDTNDAKDVAGRVFVQPWRAKGTSPLRGLGFGVAATTGKASGALRGYSSVSQVTVFSYASTVTASGTRWRWSPQAYLFAGPVGILAEYVESHHRVEKTETGAPLAAAALTNSAWSVGASYLLTGEEASYGSVKPKNFFVPSAGQWGAWQLVARINRLTVDEATFHGGFADPSRSVRQATAWGAGVNWIWNANLKLMLDYERTRFRGGAAARADRRPENSVQTRLQLSY
jgi:phosphate-selective porin OprO and OprP